MEKYRDIDEDELLKKLTEEELQRLEDELEELDPDVGHTHTHTHIYIYIYMYVYVSIYTRTVQYINTHIMHNTHTVHTHRVKSWLTFISSFLRVTSQMSTIEK